MYDKNYLEEDKFRQNNFSYPFCLYGKWEESEKRSLVTYPLVKYWGWGTTEPLVMTGDSKEGEP